MPASLSASLDSAWMNAGAASPPHARATRHGEATSQKSKSGVVLPSAQEMGLRTKPVISTPQYEPKQWSGVSALTGDDWTPSSNAVLQPAAKADLVRVHKKDEVPSVLPSHELARKARMSKDESSKGGATVLAASWTGISGSLVDAQRPSPEHRRRPSLEPASAPASKHEPEAELSVSPDGIHIPSSRELAGSGAVRAPAPTALRPNPRVAAGSPNWLGIARFSSMSSITYSPSPPKRRSASKGTENDEDAETTPKRVSLPSSLDLGILPKQNTKTVFNNRSNRLNAGYDSITHHNWSGVSAVLVD